MLLQRYIFWSPVRNFLVSLAAVAVLALPVAMGRFAYSGASASAAMTLPAVVAGAVGLTLRRRVFHP